MTNSWALQNKRQAPVCWFDLPIRAGRPETTKLLVDKSVSHNEKKKMINSQPITLDPYMAGETYTSQ